MSGLVREKGKFAKLSVVNKKKRAVAAMAAGKAKKRLSLTQQNAILENIEGNVMAAGKVKKKTNLIEETAISENVEGNRIVNLKELGKNLICSNCGEVLNLNNIIEETRQGLDSQFRINCHKCEAKNLVSTSSSIQSRGSTFSKVNLAAVLGAIYAGIGPTQLNKILSCLNVPTISLETYRRYELEVGPAIEKTAEFVKEVKMRKINNK